MIGSIFTRNRLLQVLAEPIKYVSQTLNAQFGMASARKTMALTFETYKKHLTPEIFERSKKLLGLLNITAQILLAMNNKQRSMNILYVCDGRHAHITIQVIPGCGFKLIIREGPTQVT